MSNAHWNSVYVTRKAYSEMLRLTFNPLTMKHRSSTTLMPKTAGGRIWKRILFTSLYHTNFLKVIRLNVFLPTLALFSETQRFQDLFQSIFCLYLTCHLTRTRTSNTLFQFTNSINELNCKGHKTRYNTSNCLSVYPFCLKITCSEICFTNILCYFNQVISLS
jgi:hypothetical protein